MDAVKNYIKEVVNEVLVEKGLVGSQPAEPVAEASAEAPSEPQPTEGVEGAESAVSQ